MKRLLPFALILLAAGCANAAPSSVTRADFLANKKTNIEGRGKVYDPQQWSDHFDRMDANHDGILTAQEQADYDASKKTTAVVKAPASKAPAPAKKSAPKPASKAAASVSGSMAPFEGNPATTVWFNQPGKGFDQSLVIGNGRVGAMVFGGVNEERIVLNEESVWSGSRGENNVPGGYQYLPEMRRLLAEEKFTEANALKRKAFPTKGAPKYSNKISPFGRFQTLGNLRLKFSGNSEAVTDYRRELDLSTGMASVRYQQGETVFTREHFVSAPDEVFVSRLSGPLEFTISMDRAERFATTAVSDRELLMTGHLNDGYDQDGLQYVGRLRVIGGSVKAVGHTLEVESDGEVLLLFAAATDYRGIAGRQLSDPLAATSSDLDKAEGKVLSPNCARRKRRIMRTCLTV